MGCSFTFGEGVNDDETLASRFSDAIGDTANVVNLGVHGYGPHQMLRLLELNRLPGVHSPVKQVIYQAIYWHVRRSAGRALWDLSGPRYEIAGDSVIYRGPFHGQRTVATMHVIAKSHAARYFLEHLYFNESFNDQELEVYGRVVERAALLARRNLGSGFTILYWDDDNPLARRVLSRLRQTRVPLILVSSIIPRSEWGRVRFPYDRHPTPEANRRIASALAGRADSF